MSPSSDQGRDWKFISDRSVTSTLREPDGGRVSTRAALGGPCSQDWGVLEDIDPLESWREAKAPELRESAPHNMPYVTAGGPWPPAAPPGDTVRNFPWWERKCF